MTDLLRYLTVHELIAELQKYDPYDIVVTRTPHPMYPFWVAPAQHVVSAPARDFGGYRNLGIVLDEAMSPETRARAEGKPLVVVVIGDGRAEPMKANWPAPKLPTP